MVSVAKGPDLNVRVYKLPCALQRLQHLKVRIIYIAAVTLTLNDP